MINFLNFTVRYFAFNFAAWLLLLCDTENNHPTKWFWSCIDSDPYHACEATVQFSTELDLI